LLPLLSLLLSLSSLLLLLLLLAAACCCCRRRRRGCFLCSRSSFVPQVISRLFGAGGDLSQPGDAAGGPDGGESPAKLEQAAKAVAAADAEAARLRAIVAAAQEAVAAAQRAVDAHPDPGMDEHVCVTTLLELKEAKSELERFDNNNTAAADPSSPDASAAADGGGASGAGGGAFAADVEASLLPENRVMRHFKKVLCQGKPGVEVKLSGRDLLLLSSPQGALQVELRQHLKDQQFVYTEFAKQAGSSDYHRQFRMVRRACRCVCVRACVCICMCMCVSE
jgi:hypothetical protein